MRASYSPKVKEIATTIVPVCNSQTNVEGLANASIATIHPGQPSLAEHWFIDIETNITVVTGSRVCASKKGFCAFVSKDRSSQSATDATHATHANIVMHQVWQRSGVIITVKVVSWRLASIGRDTRVGCL